MGGMPSVSFRSLQEDDLQRVVGWFDEPAVAQWWNEPAELSSVRAKYVPRIEGREATSMWIAEIDDEPAGLFQCYRHADYPEHDACAGIPEAVGIDYLIGDSHRGRGLGRTALRAFAAFASNRHPDTQVCVATPAQSNTASWRALEYAGFTRRGTCQPPDEPVAFVYALEHASLESDDQNTVNPAR